MKRVQDLLVWKKAHELVLDVYRITEHFPAEERAALTSQMRRTALLIPANIVEGYTSANVQDFIHATMAAEAALARLRYYLELSRELGYLFHEHFELFLENVDSIEQSLRGVRAEPQPETIDARR